MLGPCTWVLLPSVEQELVRLEAQSSKKNPLLLSLLRSRAECYAPDIEGHTDDEIYACALEMGWATLTVDTALKHRLYEANLRVVEVRQNTHLYLVDSL